MMTSLFDIHSKPSNYLNLRIPYQGSKQKIATNLIDAMLRVKPKAKYFYDLCGGGGSMSFTALEYGLNVYYNEIHKPIAGLLQYILDRSLSAERSEYGLFPAEWYKFVSHAEFMKQRRLDTPYSEFVRICYSFGNNRRSYAFGVPIRRLKELAHNMIVFRCTESLREFNEMSGTHFTISNESTMRSRFLYYKSEWNAHMKEDLCLSEMIESKFILRYSDITTSKKKEWAGSQLTRLEQLENLQHITRLQQLENLQHIERFQHIENIEQLTPFSITSLDYRDVIITTPKDETIVYIDPPYRNTGGYGQDFDVESLDQWFVENEYPCFMSEYNAPHQSIFEIKKAAMFKNTGIDKRPIVMEKLFYNGK